MDDVPVPSKLGQHGGPRHPTAGQGDEKSDITLKSRGTGKQYILERLRRDQRFDLIDGVQQRQISAYAAGIEAGYFRRPLTRVVDNDHNKTRLRMHEMDAVLGRSAFVCAELPCLSCNHPDAWRALKEVAATYVRGRRGEVIRSASGVLPASCCRRAPARLDVRAMIA
jgi:hypothetical protein